MDAVDHCPLQLDIHVSVEKEKLLGTGGAFGPIKTLFQGDHLLVINGDIVSNIDLKGFIENHSQLGNYQ